MKSNNVPASLEVTEAANLTNLRKKLEAYFSLRTGKPLEGRVMLKIGFLPNGTKSIKTSDGLVSDIVLNSFHVADATAQGEPIKLITVNERVGLSKAAKPLDKGTALNRVVGAVFSGLSEIANPREANKAGKMVRPRAYAETLKTLGWADWRTPLNHGDSFIAAISPKVDLPVDAFELPAPPKATGERKVYKAEIRDETGKLLGTANISKSLFDTYRDKTANLHMSFISVDADSLTKANQLSKALNRLEANSLSTEAKLIAEAKQREDIEAAVSAE